MAPGPSTQGGGGQGLLAVTGGPRPSPPPARNGWAQLLEQASDFNDELHKENCELHREVSVLRQKQQEQVLAGVGGNDGSGVNRALRTASVLPRVMAHLKRALQGPLPDSEGLSAAIEEAVRRVVVAAAESARGGPALASGEDTAALVAEKVALKEFCMRQQERLLELELAREKLSGSAQGNWASRFSSITSALQGTLGDQGSAAATTPPQQAAVPLPEAPRHSVGDECEVVGKKGAILRESEDMESEKVATLPPGSRVRVLELGAPGGRRARVQAVDMPTAAAAPEGEAAAIEEGTSLTAPGAAATTPAYEGTLEAPENAAVSPAPAAAVSPPVGWLSISTKDGKALIRTIVTPLEDPPKSPELPELTASATLAPGSAAEGPPQQPGFPTEDTSGTPTEGAVATAEGGAILDSPIPAAAQTSSDARDEPVRAGSVPGTVTVSTDAWMSLRYERNQRERQIKALQVQVETAHEELAQLAAIKAQLREQRNLALEARRRGNELREAALMAAEDLVALRMEAADEPEKNEEVTASTKPEEALQVEDEACGAAAGVAASYEAEERGRSVEWQRLLSERETTARELGRTLERIEELEALLEDRRVELQLAEKRRGRERSSLLTALRELRAREGGKLDAELDDLEAVDPADGGSTSAAESQPSGVADDAAGMQQTTAGAVGRDKELHYLHKISRLEETAARLRAQLEKVQAREAALNESAVTRGAALRYATSTFAAAGADAASGVALASSTTAGEAPRSTGRADLDGLMEMLDRLFVENFALRGGGRGNSSRNSGAGAAANSKGKVVTDPVPVDLSRFVLPEGGASEEEEEATEPGAPSAPNAQSAQGTSRSTAAVLMKSVLPASPAVRVPAAHGPASAMADTAASPRSKLLQGLNFHSLPVAED